MCLLDAMYTIYMCLLIECLSWRARSTFLWKLSSSLLSIWKLNMLKCWLLHIRIYIHLLPVFRRRFSGHGSQLLSFLVDLLLSDYWATLHTNRYMQQLQAWLGCFISKCFLHAYMYPYSDIFCSAGTPLFMRVLWTCKESPRINPSVRELIKELANLLQTFTTSRENVSSVY